MSTNTPVGGSENWKFNFHVAVLNKQNQTSNSICSINVVVPQTQQLQFQQLQQLQFQQLQQQCMYQLSQKPRLHLLGKGLKEMVMIL